MQYIQGGVLAASIAGGGRHHRAAVAPTSKASREEKLDILVSEPGIWVGFFGTRNTLNSLL